MVVAAFALVAGCDHRASTGEPRAQAGSAAAPALDATADSATAPDATLDAPPSGSAAADAPAPAALPTLDAGPGAEAIVTAWRPRPGASAMIRFDAKLDFDLNFGGIKTITSTTQIKRKKVEILAVDRDGTIHKRITYLQRDTHIILDGEERKDPSPVRGKAFLVAWRDGITDVRHAGGAPATPEEVDAVRAEELLVQVPELLGKALSGLRLIKDQPFEVPIAALSRLLSGEFHARRMVLTYRGKTRDGARLDAEGALASETQGMTKFVDLKGELVIDPAGWCRRAKIDGQFRVEYNGSVVGSGAGTGTMTASALR